MPRLGTYSTFGYPCDCTLEVEKEAEDFLRERFEKIGGTVRKVLNPHDFGSYPSFEIDYPHTMSLNEDEYDDEESLSPISIFDNEACVIEDEYSEKFNKYL